MASSVGSTTRFRLRASPRLSGVCRDKESAATPFARDSDLQTPNRFACTPPHKSKNGSASASSFGGPVTPGCDEPSLACRKRATDELEFELTAIGIDVGDHFGKGRSSSAAKNAEAVFKISFARRNSRFSRRSLRSSSSSSLPGPASTPPSRRACFNQPRIVCGQTPSLAPTVCAADHCDDCVS